MKDNKAVLHAIMILIGMSAAFVVLRLLGGNPFNPFDFASGLLCSVLAFVIGLFASEAVISLVEKVSHKEVSKEFYSVALSVGITAIYLILYFKVNWK